MAKTYEFGKRVKERRQALGLTLREAARRLDLSPSRLGAIERGVAYSTGNATRPRRDLVERVADVFELPRDLLLASAGYVTGAVADLDEDTRHLVTMFVTLPPERKRIALGFMQVLSDRS